MKTAFAASLAATLGALLTTSPASHAALETVYNISTSSEACASFTPGVTNTIRNRVVGSENVGTDPLAVACSFANIGTVQGGYNTYLSITVFNNSASNISVTCTELNGQYNNVVSTINKTGNMGPGAGVTIAFTANDTPSTTDTDLGSYRSGVNCVLPAGGVLSMTETRWQDDFA